MKSKLLSKENRKHIWDILLFLGPSFLLYSLFFTIPLIQGVYYSLTDWNGVSEQVNFVGLSNYIGIFTNDEGFLNAMQITIYIAMFSVLLTNFLAMLFAIALTTDKKINSFFRTVIFLPNVISMVISGFIWKFMFSQIFMNIYKTTGVEFFNNDWLGDARLVIYAVIIVTLWQGIGYVMIIYIAALLSFDLSVVEASLIDGASKVQCFFKIKLPLMLPTVLVGVFLTVSGSLKVFDTVYPLTGGGPGRASEVAMLNIYREAYVFNHPNFACAKAVLLSILIIAITIVQLKFSSNREVEV